ncbi:MAG: hypothetical protein J5515_07370 [Lachnospiraceae bacterium]|nr:hypothetical protein [Lachnospiraceae bacterium]
MFKKTMKFVGATAILGICVFTLSYIYVLRTTINDLEADASMEKLRARKYTDIIVGGRDKNLDFDVVEKDTLYNVNYKVYDLPKYYPYYGQKAYENYTAITNRFSKQYKIEEVAHTDEYGFRIYDDRYLIAIGTYFNAPVGTYIDVELENGVIIPCIVGDIKADVDTDANNVYSLTCGCASEFIVDGYKINPYTRGDVSSIFEDWESPVVHIIVYEHNFFDA